MTSNEIATRDEHTALTQAPQNQFSPALGNGLEVLTNWAEQADLAYQIAERMAQTSFVSTTLRGKPIEIAAAVLTGIELGFSPMASLKAIDIIQGQPALRAHAMRGLVQSHGHEVELVESTSDRCVMRGRRKGAEKWQQIEWTTQRASDLGLLDKAEWKKQRQTMLVNRATGEICRLIASDVLHGVPYCAEELDGYVHGEVVKQKRAPLSVAALTAPVATDEQPVDSDVVDVDTDDDEHAAAVQELRDFGADQGIANDVDALAHEALGAPLEHVSAQAIRDLTAKFRAAAAQKENAA